MHEINARQKEIVQQVVDRKKISVAELSQRMNVSQVTIRKDLSVLEENGLLSRSHGYAVARSSADINNRMDYDYDTKLRIARRAADLIQEGETIMVESGSSCALFCLELAQQKKNVTIITNSAFIADYIRSQEAVRIILLGGEYQKDSQAMVGPLLTRCAQAFRVEKFFLGTDGYTEEDGFLVADPMRSQAAHDMAARADSIYILTDSHKFSQKSLVSQFPPEQVHTVVTDTAIPQPVLEALESHGTNVITC